MKVLFCIVTYRTDDVLGKYLRSIRAAAESFGSGLILEVLVIDNSMRAESKRAGFVARIEADVSARCAVVFPPANLGYFGC